MPELRNELEVIWEKDEVVKQVVKAVLVAFMKNKSRIKYDMQNKYEVQTDQLSPFYKIKREGVEGMQDSKQVFIENPLIWKYEKRYILGTNENAAALFIELCTRRIYIQGFIDDQNAGILFFHKPVYAVKEVDLEEDVILLSKEVCDEYDSYKLCSDICVLNPRLFGKKVLIHGAEEIIVKVNVLLHRYGVEAVELIKSGRLENDILSYAEMSPDKDMVIIEAGSNDRSLEDIIGFQDRNIQIFYIDALPFESKKIWVDRKHGITITPGVVAQLGEYIEYEHIKEIILYGNNLTLAWKCAEVFENLDFTPVSFMIDGEKNMEEGVCVKSIEEIVYKDDYLVLVYEKDVRKLFNKLHLLRVEQRRYGKVCPWVSPNFNTREPLLDVHMGYTYEMNSEYPGIQIYGKNQSNDFKIAVLGDSTTDSASDARICPWTEIMYERYCKSGITIFNGGMSGYYSGQELVKLKRDMLKLNPNMIIVYDGYNDLMQSVLHKKFGYLEDLINLAREYVTEADGRILQQKKAWAGIPSDQKPVDEWIENIECMYAIAKNKNIDFFSFMQPMLFTKKNLDQHSKTILQTMLFHGNNFKFMKFADEFRNRAREIEKSHSYIHDLTYIFDDEDVYMDIVHVYEKGNEIIASRIWNVVKESIK